MKRRRVVPFRASVLAAVAAAAGGTGCVIESEPPDSATFRVVATQPVQVITSTVFNSLFSCTPNCVVADSVAYVASDTIQVTGRYEGTVAMDTPGRIFVRATSLAEGNVVSLEVLIRDDLAYDFTRTLGTDEYLQYVFCAVSLGFPTRTRGGPDWSEMALGCPLTPAY